jgi:RNA polymerase sigma-70 factor (ECF subfamily)
VQRSAIILKDVLGQPLEEVAATMGTTVGAVKAALSRGRHNIARTSHEGRTPPAPPPSVEQQAMLRRYVDLFNDRNWDGLRALLGEESRLDLVSRAQRRVEDAQYYDRYAELLKTEDIRAEAGFVDGVAAIAMFSPASSPSPAYFVLLESSGGRISRIRDFRYIRYIAADARFSKAN